MRKSIITVAVASATVLLAAGCGSVSHRHRRPVAPSTSNTAGTTASKFLGCMVTDTGGINDKSFNASAWQGMQEAAAADPSKITVKYAASTSGADYAPNISAFLGQKCGIIVTVGYLMATATGTAATVQPGAKFAIVDCAIGSASCAINPNGKPSKPPANVDSLVYNTVQDGFLGGYLAAGMSKTGKVATYGGIKIPTVTIYMDGFWDGVQYYNSQHHTHVAVLGWNEKTQAGEFANSFTNLTHGPDVRAAVHLRGRGHHLPGGRRRRPRFRQGGAER